MADNISNEFDRIVAQTPKPCLMLWWLHCDECLIELRPCLIRRGRRLIVAIVVVTIQTITIQVLLVDLSTCSNNVGSADVDNVWETHDAIIEMIEHNITFDK